ncbi:MAG: DNA repair protein RecN [Clostridiales bacterium]|nr:DNA repair protein RecN [Clostridiales bacterium]MDY2728564.1 DNA repair protein RecN [Clostridium sp.]NLK23124.1 DNA repair protein RecN [Clostridiales bacterium]
MLIQLNIKNFALIEELTVDFKEGFNILSGETGAGKSILIDAIDYVLGGKFSKDLIRTGENKTYVEAVFSIENKNLNGILDDLGIEYEDMLIISRETSLSGKGIAKVNGKSIIVSKLKKIREKLLDIHGQHQNQSILDRNNHISFLDNYIGSDIYTSLKEYTTLRDSLIEIRNKISKISSNNQNSKILDYTKFQIEDIEKAKLSENEEESLKEEYNILSNAEKINSSLALCLNILNNDSEGSISVLEGLSKVLGEFSTLEKHLDIKEKRSNLEGAYYMISEISRDLRDMSEEIVYDEDRLSKINERIYEINTYKKKYGSTVKDILNYYEELKTKYNELINAEEILKELKNNEAETFNKLKEVGKKLHDIRLSYTSSLEQQLLEELSYVGLNKSKMKIQVDFTDEPKENGFDSVGFLISTNPGEPLKPLEKVLSGGELSRIMLAFKCVFAEKDEIATLIFDEIDTGISGAVGQRVGEKMYQVSLTHQVLCITHLPQIAILSDHHYFISKEVLDGKTYTRLKLLNEEQKIKQVSSMLGGDGVTDSTIKNVKEMLQFAKNKKNDIKNNNIHKK